MIEKYSLQHETLYRIKYGEVDAMQYVYYGNYAVFLESSRTELLRSVGVTYKTLEENGYLFPVISFHTKYLIPIRYDELVRITTILTRVLNAGLDFEYVIKNEAGQTTTTAITRLACVDKGTRRPIRLPKLLIEKLNLPASEEQ